MTKSIKNQMYKKIGVLVFFLLIAAAATFATKAKTVEPSTDKATDQAEAEASE